jgi:hypothetical protein
MTLPIKEKEYFAVANVKKKGKQLSHRVCCRKDKQKKTGVTRSLDAVHASSEQIDTSSHVPV